MSDLKTLIDKLNPVCRRAFETAAGLCVAQTNYNVEVEHLLVKLFDLPSSDAEVILKYFEIDPADVTRQANRAIEGFKRGNSRTPAMSEQVVRLLREGWTVASLRLGEPAVRSGALLLALLSDEMLRGAILQSCPSLAGVPLATLTDNLRELVQGSVEETAPATAAGTAAAPAGESRVKDSSALGRYTLDVTAEARAGNIDPIRGRDGEIRQVIDILTRRRQNNPILVGDAGVGKTAVAEGFALRVAAGEVPEPLKKIAVRTLDLGLLQAGAGIKGEFEDRLKSVIAEVKASPQPVILFIDEAHTLIGAGNLAGQGDAANLLKPALARGELRTIAATTWAEYKKYIEKDAALTRRFQLVKIDEPTEDAAVDMLRGIAPKLEQHHKVRILDEAVADSVHLSHRYLADRRLPDKAISVLDTACARVALAQDGTPAAIEDVDRSIQRAELQLDILKREMLTRDSPAGVKQGAEADSLAEELERLGIERGELEERWREERGKVRDIQQLQAELDELRRGDGDAEAEHELARRIETLVDACLAFQGEAPMMPIAVDSRTVASVISGWTGIPVGRMMADEIQGILSLKEQMAEHLVGQPQALDAICRRISTSRAGLEDPAKPKGVFLLVGPTGVGKTETAVVLARQLFGGEANMVSVNMSEFQEAHSVATLKGAPPGYVGYGKGGVLTEAVRRRPYSVVLLDEMEKAHPDVAELFFQVFDKGVLEDGEGVPVDFKHTIFLLTSNVGGDLIMAACEPRPGMPPGHRRPDPEKLLSSLRPQLLRHFRAAFLGRLVVVPYYPLGRQEIHQIVHLKLRAIQDRIHDSHQAELTFEEGLVGALAAKCTAEESGARNIDHILTQTLLPELSSRILERMARGESFERVHITVDEFGRFV